MIKIFKDNLTIVQAMPENASILGTWWRDGKIMEHAGFPNGLNISDEEIAQSLETDSDDTFRRLIIEYDSVQIGEMNYRNKGDKIAEIGIKICDLSKLDKGLGTKYIKMLIDFLFSEKKYNKIVLDTNLKNIRAQHVYEKLGFNKVEIKIDSWTNQVGELQSTIYYEIRRSDWNKEKMVAELLR